MTKLNLCKVLPASAVLAALCALPAVAGSSFTENSYNLRNTFNGNSSTSVDVTETTRRWGSGESYNSKIGTETTNVYQSSGSRDAGEFTSSSLSETDSFDVTAISTATEQFDSTSVTNVSVTDTFDYNGTSKTHRTTAGFDF